MPALLSRTTLYDTLSHFATLLWETIPQEYTASHLASPGTRTQVHPDSGVW